MPRQYSPYYLRKKKRLKSLSYKKRAKEKKKKRKPKISRPISFKPKALGFYTDEKDRVRPIVAPSRRRKKVVIKKLPITKHPSAVMKPPETVFPGDVMEEQILSIARTHLTPMELQNLQDNLRRADDKKVQELYLYWAKQGEQKEDRRKPNVPSDAEILVEVEKLQKQRNFEFVPRSELLKRFADCDPVAVTERIDALIKSGKLEEKTKPHGKLGYIGLPTKPFSSMAHFPYGDVKEKDAKYKGKPIVPKEFWDRRVGMAEWKKEDAEKLYSELKPLEGQYVILYGGSMLPTNEFWVGKLEKVEMGHPTYYDKPEPYQPKDKYVVRAYLRSGKLGTKLPTGQEEFEPLLGSWKIEQIVPDKPE